MEDSYKELDKIANVKEKWLQPYLIGRQPSGVNNLPARSRLPRLKNWNLLSRQLELVPSDQLMAMSADQYSDFMSKHEVITGTPDARMVTQVGKRISTAVERYFRERNRSGMLQGYQWEFNLIKEPAPMLGPWPVTIRERPWISG